MEQGYVRPVIAAGLCLTALVGIGSRAAAEESAQPGTLLSVAGAGKAGFSGDGGPATQATMDAPRGLALDGAGNLFIADFRNNRVRKIDPDGIMTTIAGTDEEDFAGDGGPASEATLLGPNAVAVDGTGNLYIADTRNNRVRKIDSSGIISTLTGNGEGNFSGDNGPASKAEVAAPHGVAADAAGNLYFSDPVHQRVRRVDKDGIITTVAGGGEPQDGVGDGGPAMSAQLHGPTGLAVDAAGNLFIAEYGGLGSTADGNRVRKVSPDGIITTVAGTGLVGFSGDGGKAIEATLTRPFHVALDSAGNLFIADWGNNRVRKVSPDGIITTVAGKGNNTFSGEGGPATEAGLRGPWGLVIDAAGNLLITDSASFRSDGLGSSERVLKVVGVAAPGLLAGKPFPQ